MRTKMKGTERDLVSVANKNKCENFSHFFIAIFVDKREKVLYNIYVKVRKSNI